MEAGDCAKPVTKENLASAVEGVQDVLVIAHAAGVLHRDIRRPNVMYFPSLWRWCLIDWGLGCVAGEVLPIDRDSTQFESAGRRVKCMPKDVDIEWTAVDDYEMLIQLILRVNNQVYKQLIY
jgi:serine/threonine protein kinase